MAKNFQHFCHHGKNGEKMFVIFAIMAKMARKSMARMVKIDGENEKIFFSPFGKSRKNNKRRIAISPPIVINTYIFHMFSGCPSSICGPYLCNIFLSSDLQPDFFKGICMLYLYLMIFMLYNL